MQEKNLNLFEIYLLQPLYVWKTCKMCVKKKLDYYHSFLKYDKGAIWFAKCKGYFAVFINMMNIYSIAYPL